MSVRQLKTSEVASILQQLVKKQNNVCGVCGKPFTKTDRPVLDHCHDTGYIRGALHNSCNGAEGRVKTKARLGHRGVGAGEYIIGLGKYLDKHSTPQYQLIHPSHMTEEQKRLQRNKKARLARAKKKG